MIWRFFLRPLLFRLDAERAHHLTMRLFALVMRLPFVAALVSRVMRPAASLEVNCFGRRIASPVGLAAGFDKDVRWPAELAALGFGFVEVGTLTAEAQPGNERPRLFRLPLDRALLNRFGFNNAGAADASKRLEKLPLELCVGVNIGKSKATPNGQAVEDYCASFELVRRHAAYVVVNVSSPNTKDLRALQEREVLAGLVRALQAKNGSNVPLFVKVAPDLTYEQLADVVALALELKLDGIVATNTTTRRDGLQTAPETLEALGAGGLSGAPLSRRSREFVAEIYRLSQGRLTIIGVGGVMSGEEAWQMLRAGASLVQVYSGFVYGGPCFVRALNAYLARRLVREGTTIEAIVGSATIAPNGPEKGETEI